MTWKALWVSILLAFAWTGTALWALRPVVSPSALRLFVADTGRDQYRIQAHDARNEGFCTVFVRDGSRIAGVCGQHTWTETTEER